MALTECTILDQLEISGGRFITGYFFRQVLSNGVEVARAGPHVVTVPPDGDMDQVLADVNNDITTRATLQWPAIDAGEWQRFTDTCAIHHTPEVKAAYAAWKAAQQ